MNNFKKLLALLTVYQYNIRVLHWKISGLDFDDKHSLFGSYYEEFDGFIDKVSELSMQLGNDPISFNEVHSLCENMEENVIICQGTTNYSNIDALKMIGTMFEQLIIVIESCQEGVPSDIQSELDDIKQYLRLESRYKNRRRLS